MNCNEQTQLSCPTCGKALEQRLTKKDKPYFHCEECGVQIFVRFQRGIDLLRDGGKTFRRKESRYAECRKCGIGVKIGLEQIKEPFLGKAGLYCPECEELLLTAPDDWKERLKRNS